MGPSSVTVDINSDRAVFVIEEKCRAVVFRQFSLSLCYIVPKAVPARILIKDKSWVAARLLRKKETRVDLKHLLLNRVRKCIQGRGDGYFKQLPALHALFISFSNLHRGYLYSSTDCICWCLRDHFLHFYWYIFSFELQFLGVLFLFLIRMACNDWRACCPQHRETKTNNPANQ